MKVWMDGYVMDGEDARLPVTDHGLLYGDGVFEGIRQRDGRVLWLERHLARLDRGARALGITLPMKLGAIGEVVKSTLRAHGETEAYVRLLLTRGEGPLGVDPTTCPQARVICIVAPISLFSDEQRRAGLALITSSTRRPNPDVLDPTVKSLNYLGSVMAKLEAKQAGADDALMLNGRGLVAEASVANIFAVTHGSLMTPPSTDGCLPGITRAAVMSLAEEIGLKSVESSLGRADLFGASEVFMTGSGAGVIGVRSLDGRAIGTGKSGVVTGRVSDALASLYATHGERVVSPSMRPARPDTGRGAVPS